MGHPAQVRSRGPPTRNHTTVGAGNLINDKHGNMKSVTERALCASVTALSDVEPCPVWTTPTYRHIGNSTNEGQVAPGRGIFMSSQRQLRITAGTAGQAVFVCRPDTIHSISSNSALVSGGTWGGGNIPTTTGTGITLTPIVGSDVLATANAFGKVVTVPLSVRFRLRVNTGPVNTRKGIIFMGYSPVAYFGGNSVSQLEQFHEVEAFDAALLGPDEDPCATMPLRPVANDFDIGGTEPAFSQPSPGGYFIIYVDGATANDVFMLEIQTTMFCFGRSVPPEEPLLLDPQAYACAQSCLAATYPLSFSFLLSENGKLTSQMRQKSEGHAMATAPAASVISWDNAGKIAGWTARAAAKYLLPLL